MLRVQAKIAKRDFDVDLEVPNFGEGGTQHIAIMGPNGSGKSTIIELLAGTLVPDSGLIKVGSKVFANLDDHGSGQFVAPHERRIGMLAQDALLFPHMTVLENVGFAPRSSGEDPKAAAKTALRYLELVGCAQFADRKPRELSGGQAQRVAIARTLAAHPELILLDEPMAALDFDSVPQVLELLKEILQERLSIMVTHDLLDAAALADYLVVVDRGRIVESGPIDAVLANPQSPFGERLAGFTRLRQTIQQDDLGS